MNDNTLKWVWLTTLQGMTTEKITSLLNKFDDIDEIYNAGEEEYKDIDLIHQRDIRALCDKNTKSAQKVISNTEKCGAYILTYDSKDYPEKLKYISAPPYVLYVKGTLKLNEKMFCIGVVGTRELNEYGETVTGKMTFELARAGFSVVSGLALGVDAIAASAALRAGGNTIAVLGCGIDLDYPKTNRELRKYIEQYGAVVTEYPPKTQPYPANFPQRNRIIAGLSECTLVTQAPAKSGALITAKYAHEMGREVFSVPGSVFDVNSVGNNNLIKAGATPVTHPYDLIERYKYQVEEFAPKTVRHGIKMFGVKKKVFSKFVNIIKGKDEKKPEKELKKEKPSINDEKYKNLNENEKVIMELIINNEKISVDEIIRKTNLPPAKIGSTLSMMEMIGVVKKLPGNFYVVSN